MQKHAKYHQTTSPIIVLLIALQIIFITVVLATIINLLNQNHEITVRDDRQKITISDLPAKINLPKDYAEDISLSLTSAMELNTTRLDIPSSSAIIRDGSITLREFPKEQWGALSFIVDILELGQSYQIYYKYPLTADTTTTPYFNNPRAVLCLDNNADIIYSDFNCRSTYPENTRYRIAKDYFNFLEFDGFTVAIDEQAPSTINIIPATSTNPDDALVTVKSTLESLGLSPDIFNYHITNNY